MHSDAKDFAPVRFSTRALPEGERVAMWREEVGRRLVRLDIEPMSDLPFCVDATLRSMPGLATVAMSGPAMRLERTAALVANGDQGTVGLCVNLGKNVAVSARGRDEVLGRGDAVLFPHDGPAFSAGMTGWLGVVIPYDALTSRVAGLDDAVMRKVPCCSAALRLLKGYIDQLNVTNLGTLQLLESVVSHIHDLAALALGANEAVREGGMNAVAAARLGAARTHIERSLAEPELTVAAVARRLGVSPRHLQRLFEVSGTSFTAYVNELRLQRALALLTAPPASSRRIADIALEAGFSDISHFNRLFRARFGDTPRGVRAGSSGRN
jgi:AraC-like DNA-binding protein